VRVSGEFRNLASVLADPTVVTFQLELPDGTVLEYVYGASPDGGLAKSATGQYYIDITAEDHGMYRYRWHGAGLLMGAVDGRFYVRDSGPEA
jgi:hypothetical protein